MPDTVLFLYGTLKRGGAAHRMLAGQRFLREAETEPRYRVYDLGRYPGLAADPATGLAVTGGLWEVDAACLAKLDAYEGVPDLFIRGAISIVRCERAVEAYFYNRPVPAGAHSGDSWPFRS